MAKTFVLSEAMVRELSDLIAWKKSISGPGVHSTARTLLIRQPVVRQRSAPAIPPSFRFKVFRITDSTQDGSNLRWTYTGNEVEKTSEGYGGWTDVEGGLEDQTLYSLAEDQQTGTVAGDVDTDGDDYPDGFSAMPIADGTRVVCMAVPIGGETEWWIVNRITAHDGTCEAEE